MASAGGENAGKRSIERAGNLLLAELLQTAWCLLVEEDFFNETGVAEVLETQSDAGCSGVHEPLHVALDFRADGFSGEALCGGHRLGSDLGTGFTEKAGMPFAGTCEEVSRAAENVGLEHAELVASAQFSANPWAVILGAE